MLDFEEFSKGNGWYYSVNRNTGLIVASTKVGDRYEIMRPGRRYLVDTVEEAYAEVLGAFARHMASSAFRERPEDAPYLPIAQLGYYCERSGFRPGTYEPYGVATYVCAAFTVEGRDGDMLIGSVQYRTRFQDSRPAFVQVHRDRELKWTQAEIEREFVDAARSVDWEWVNRGLDRLEMAEAPRM